MKSMVNAAKRFAEESGMAFYSGFAGKMTETRLDFPALWMEPGEFAAKRESEGETTTRKVKMHLMRLDGNFSAQQVEEVWEAMREDALRLFETMAQDETVEPVRKFVCVPSQSRLTNYGEISMTVSFEAGTIPSQKEEGGSGGGEESVCEKCVNYYECYQS